MLKRLRVKNFALIENLDLIFSPGFNVLTGETGAGKSIILGALNLLFGDRASSEMFREGEDELYVEGTFEVEAPQEDIIIKREMYRGGKSYVFIDDKQVTLQTLRETTSRLAEIMGQHQHQGLLNPVNHVQILDRFGSLEDQVADFQEKLKEWRRLRDEIEDLKNSKQKRLQQADYFRFQLSEIESAGLKPEEEDELKREKAILNNAAALKELSTSIYSLLYDDQDSVFEQANRCREFAERLRRIDDSVPLKIEEMENIIIMAEELGKAAAAYGEGIENDPLRLETVEARLAEIDRLKTKYGRDVSEILAYADEIRKEIDVSDNFDTRHEELSRILGGKTVLLLETGQALDESRKQAAEALSVNLKKTLSAMGMKKMEFKTVFVEPDAGITVDHQGRKYTITENGLSNLEFFISPNPGEGVRPLRKIASGGEISRVMLSVKTSIAEKDNVRLLIFDEVDTGISGETAIKVGRLLRDLSQSHQVICITHLQQIASAGDAHFAVEKKTIQKRTLTFVRKLSEKERVSEIARLISGDSRSRDSIRYAEKLLSDLSDLSGKSGNPEYSDN
jgi:DNA repair protein RecN (Recombination protein N)